MYGNEHFSIWLLMPHRPEDFYAKFRNGKIWDDEWVLPVSFVFAETM